MLAWFVAGLVVAMIPAPAEAQNPFLTKDGKRVITKITFYGNHVTREYVLRRELGFTEGDEYDPVKVSDAWERLEQLDFIAYVDIQEKRVAPGEIQLMIQVEEDRRFAIAPTYSYERRYHGHIVGLDLSVRNLRGRAETLELTTAWGALHGYDLRWHNPEILAPLKLGVFAEGQWKRYDFRYQPLDLTDWELAAGAWHDFGRWARLAASYHWRELQVDHAKAPFQDGTGKDPAVVVSLTHDSRDVRYYPSRGILADARVRLAGLGEPYSYQIFQSSLAAFYSVPVLDILAGRMAIRTASDPLPFYERSYMGGPMSLRGIDFGSVRGDDSWLATLEIRHPLVLVPLRDGKTVGLGVHAFHDWGRAWEHGAGFDSARLRWDYGIGAHINLNTKNVRLEWARTDENDNVFVIEDRFTF